MPQAKGSSQAPLRMLTCWPCSAIHTVRTSKAALSRCAAGGRVRRLSGAMKLLGVPRQLIGAVRGRGKCGVEWRLPAGFPHLHGFYRASSCRQPLVWVNGMATYPHLVGDDDQRPSSVHAERTILGGMLVDPVAIVDATMLLRADDFALDSHRRIYSAILRLTEAQYGVDIVTVSEELRRNKELDSIGGVAYLASLSEGLPRKLSIESYVRIVRDKSLMRQLMTVCDVGMVDAADQSQLALDVLNNVSSRLIEISEHAVTKGFSDIPTIVKDSFGSIDALYE